MRILGVSNWAWLFEIGDGLLEYWGIISCTGSWYEFLPPIILNIIELNPPLSLGVVLDLLNLGPLLLLSLYFISGGRDVNWGHVLNSYLCRFSQPHLFFSPRFGSRRVKKRGCGATRVSPEHHWRPPAPKVLAVPAKQGSQRVISRHGVVRQEMVRGSQPCVAPVCNFTSLGEAKLQMDLLGSAWPKLGTEPKMLCKAVLWALRVT